MANNNSERIDDLVAPEALKQLTDLDDALEKSYQNMEKLLKPTQEVEKALSKAAMTYKDLIDTIAKYEAISRRVTTNQTQANQTQRQIIQLQERINSAYSEESMELERLRQVMQQITRTRRNLIQEQNAQTGSTNQLRAQLNLLLQSYDAMSASTRNSPIGRQVHTDIQRLTQEVSELEKGTGRFSRNVGNYMNKIGAAFSVFLGNLYTKGLELFISAIGNGINKIIEFEKANSVLAAVLGENKENIKDLSDSAIDLGKTSSYTASQVTELQTELAKLGFSKNEIKNSQKDILNFAIALNANLADAATLAGASLRAFGADTKETERYVAAMTIAANKSALGFSDLATAMPIVAPVAKAFNFSIEDTLALLGKLSDNGFDASMAATALRNILLNLADSNGKLAKAIGEPVTNLDEMIKGFKDLKDRGIDLATAFELTDKRSVAAFQAFLQGVDDIVPLRDSLLGLDGQLQKLADDQMNNVSGSIDKLKSAWESLMLAFSNGTGPLKTVIDWMTSLVNKIERAVDASKELTGRRSYRESLDRSYNDSFNSAMTSFSSVKGTNVSAETVYKGIKSRQEQAISRAEKELGSFNENIQGLINSGIIRTISDKDQKVQDQLRFNLDAYKKGLDAINDAYKESTTPSKVETPKGSGIKVLTDAEIKKAETERKRRAKEEQKAIQSLSEFEIKQETESNKAIVSDSKLSLDKRIEYLGFYVESSKKLIDQSEKNQIASLEKDKMTKRAYDDSVTLIHQKASTERSKIDLEATKTAETIYKDHAEELIKTIQQRVTREAKAISLAEDEALDHAELAYLNKEMSAREYEIERTDISRKASMDRMRAEIDSLNEILSTEDMTGDQRQDLNQKLLDAELAYEQYINKEKRKDRLKTAKEQEEIEKRLAEKRKELLTEALNLFKAVFSAQTESQLAALDKQSEANDDYFSEQEDKIERLADAGAISDEQAEARKAALAQQQKDREASLEEQKKEINRRQAKFEKAQSVATIAINTASAIMKNTAMFGWPASIPLNILTAALGAAQIATVLATPIPEYAKGTDDHKGGLAVVGDGGRSELVITPDNKMYKTPSRSTLVDLPAGSQVMPDFNKAILAMSMQQLITPILDNKTIVIAENERQIELAAQNNKLLSNMGGQIVRAIRNTNRNNSLIRY